MTFYEMQHRLEMLALEQEEYLEEGNQGAAEELQPEMDRLMMGMELAENQYDLY